MVIQQSLTKGIACGVAAGVCWGVIFLGPALTPGLSGTAFAVLRFMCYGLFSVILLLPRWRRVCATLTRADWVSLFWLSLIGNVLYYALVGTGVQQVGVATTSLIVGLIPVFVALAGRRDAHAVPIRRLAPSLCSAMAGVALISFHALGAEHAAGTGATHKLGLLCAFGALSSWSWYAVSNARRLAIVQVSAHDWALLTESWLALNRCCWPCLCWGPNWQPWTRPRGSIIWWSRRVSHCWHRWWGAHSGIRPVACCHWH